MRNSAIENIVASYVVQQGDISLLTRNKYTSEDFQGDPKIVLAFVEKHIEEYGQAPSAQAVEYELGDKYSSVIINESPLYLEQSLISHMNYNALHKAIQGSQGVLSNGSPEDVTRAIEGIISQVGESLQRQRTGSTGHDLTQDTTRLREYEKRVRGEGEPILKMNIDALDEILGGIMSDDLIVAYARPGVGKSFLLTYLASQLHLQGLNVLFYSGEMEESQVGYRFDSMRAGVSNRALNTGQVFPVGTTDYYQYQEYLTELAESKNYFRIVTPVNDFNGKMPTVVDFENLVDEMKPDVIFIDQLSLVADSNRARDTREKYHNVIRDLRMIAGTKRLPVFVAAQANRAASVKNESGEFDIPDVHNLAESDAVGQYATRVIGIASKRIEGSHLQILKLGVRKNRHATLGEFELMVDFDKGNFEEIAPGQLDQTPGTGVVSDALPF